ncbi:MAG: hypothetical protein ACE5E5_08555 [Phycisphaerae bacterium]
MTEASEILDDMIDALETRARKVADGDAIDRVLSGPVRRSTASSLRDHEAVRAFRRELSDGMIRVDTVNRLLGLVGKLIALMPLL